MTLRKRICDAVLSIFREKRPMVLGDAVIRGEMELHYQPKVDMMTGITVGVEALLRWKHPSLGLLSPASFSRAMPAGFNGVIDIGHWVVETAVRQISNWQKEGLSMPVSVNILATELTHGDFYNWLEAVFARFPDVSPSMLELEIVESCNLEDMNAVMRVITECKAMGVKIALDDFGTGYSSLSYVRFIPADHVKIDQSFIRHITHNHQDRGIVQLVISLADNFGCKVIAEGVESISHGKILLQLGCRYAQGYAIAKPMPADELHCWVSEYECHPEWIAHGEKQTVLFN